MSNRRQLNLNLFIYPGGHHEAAWRYKGSAADRVLDIGYYQELAQRAEAHKFDAIFFADGPALADNVHYAQRFRLEPITWLSAIAAVTCVYRKLKLGRSGDEVRPGWQVT